jgi:hypothetical protein
MSKVLKIVGTVVAVVAIVASAAVTFGASLGLSAAAIATATTVASVAGLAAAGLGLAAAAFAPKPTFSTQGNPLQFQTNPQSGLPYPIGRTRMSGVRIHADTYDATSFKSEGKDDMLAFAVLLGAGGPMQGIDAFKADGAAVTFDGSGNATGTFANYMAQKVSLGLAGASALALAFGGGSLPGWTSAHKLSGIAHTLWYLRYDEKGEKFGAGVPEPQWIGRWVKVYDPRKDSTYPGGSGAHRALNESTYEWSRNGALHALTWALGRWQNSKRTLGIGAPVQNIRVADFVEAANVADANHWYCGGVEWSTDSKWSTLKRMLQAAGAEPTMTGAMIGCRVNTPRVAIATIEGRHLLDGLSIATTKSRRDRFNTVIPRYRSEAHDWEIVSGTPVSVSTYVTEDDGPRTKEIDFPLVQHELVDSVDGQKQAGELAAYEIVNSREAGPIRFTTGPQFIGIKTGDVVTLDVPDEGLDAQPVLIRSRSIDPSTFKITFEAETETTAKHDFALGKTTVPPPTYTPTPPDLTPPTPLLSLWTLAVAGPTGNALPGIVIAGTCEFPGADSVIVEYRKVGAANWSTVGKQPASAPVRCLVTGLEGGASYEARIAYQSGNRIGGYRTLAAVTTPSFSVIDINEVVANFDSRNDRDGSAIPACTIATDGTAVDHVLPGNANADISFEWGFSGVETGIDRFEVLVVTRTSASAYTPGSTPSIETVYDVPRHCRAFIALGVSPTNYTTFAVRAVRVVDPDVNATRRIVSAWAKPTASGENPYRPDTQIAFTGNVSGTVNGVFATTVSAAVINFDGRNDRDGSAVTAPTVATDGTAVDHTKRSGGVLADISFQFSYSAPIAGVDWHEVMVRASTSSAAYTPGTTPTQETIIRIPASKWGVILQGFPPTLYYTFAVRTIRTVDPDIDPNREIRSAWVKATGSGENPYRPESQTAYDGIIGDTLTGVPATTIAATVDPVTGNIADAKVVADSIHDDAINVSDWREQGITLVFTTSDDLELTWGGGPSVIGGDRVVLGYSFTWEISVTNPVQGTEYWFDVTPHRANSSSVIIEEYTGWRESVVWTGPTTAGSFTFGKRLTTKLRPVDAPPAGNWNFGLTIETPAQNGLVIYPNWAINIDDKRAAQ